MKPRLILTGQFTICIIFITHQKVNLLFVYHASKLKIFTLYYYRRKLLLLVLQRIYDKAAFIVFDPHKRLKNFRISAGIVFFLNFIAVFLPTILQAKSTLPVSTLIFLTENNYDHYLLYFAGKPEGAF